MNYFSGDLASIDWLGSKLISRNYYRTHACTGTVAAFLDLLVDLLFCWHQESINQTFNLAATFEGFVPANNPNAWRDRDLE